MKSSDVVRRARKMFLHSTAATFLDLYCGPSAGNAATAAAVMGGQEGATCGLSGTKGGTPALEDPVRHVSK